MEVSSRRRGGSGSKKVEDYYYNKDDYTKLSHDQKGKLKKIHEKRGFNSGRGGYSEPKSKMTKLDKQQKKYLFTIRELK